MRLTTSQVTDLLFYKDAQNKIHAELVTTLPNAVFLENKGKKCLFTGMVLVTDWFGKQIKNFEYDGSGRYRQFETWGNTSNPHPEVVVMTKCYIDYYSCTYSGGQSYCRYEFSKQVACDGGSGGGGWNGGNGNPSGGPNGGGTGNSPGPNDYPGATQGEPQPSENLKKIAKSTTTMMVQQVAILNRVLEQFLECCINKAFFNQMVTAGVKLDFKVTPMQLSEGGFKPIEMSVSFKGNSAINYDVLTEELFHAYQNLYYPGGIAGKHGTIGGSNLEFEAKLLRDIEIMKKFMPCCLTIQTTNEDNAAYFDWLRKITADVTKHPTDFSELQDKYFDFLELFKKSWPAYFLPTDPNLKPEALLNLYKNSGCTIEN
ncbi:hypothetical protein KTO58_17280 [Chitinophaga pendula]|uniref:hypothetical protein n=1 Tax=Chitinophaga TaxID=79328 RepID=UPI000BAFA446|nr:MULTISPECIES: hypothetical protein [Chitinophaga]ASZ11547.1 hypothetical protein CK934_11560 [Chitinophaga sp. MD30]UCJ05443.1 hypothetical protein KTO58_17280 [Chitinophaga pendula]